MMAHIYGYKDKETTYSELTAIAYDTKTPDRLAEHYRSTIKVAECSAKSWKIEPSLINFLVNPETGRISGWFDPQPKDYLPFVGATVQVLILL